MQQGIKILCSGTRTFSRITIRPESRRLLSIEALEKVKLAKRVLNRNNKKSSIILIDGLNVIKEAFNAGLQLHTFFYSNDNIFDEHFSEYIFDISDECLCKIPKWYLNSMTSVQTNRGVAALFFKPKTSSFDEISMASDKELLPVTLICDNVRDPGNLGNIIRSAAAANCSSVILTHGCADPWQPKVMRSASGSQFQLPIYYDITWGQISCSKALKSMNFYLAECMRDQYQYLQNTRSTSHISNEKKLVPYYDIDWTHKSGALLAIGNEAHGFKLNTTASVTECCDITQRITIPLCHRIQSLNVATAASIILFEASRQMDAKRHYLKSC
ncbi:uncharacterized protein TRIADDRAFT_59713 [Trichoplax adhaerens]|uniref:tRNA/rRNA methyltransferase SpoU type domain-containing protein n=1 Tax=Trichoplax adhaerens TaxID=10228 RepID=B3S684_TRIAD|nr:hypothetical protein TRIADDRAFT_59713 [Trichoplax adhaerens]EDV21713.1 hypothetical protein TRIADDRAFT_59713 [Trichoplax adhaerens]|eukprot:XP_002115861.1 hypothetical protein TRIADDRAFT_59713 [Trichoplax adhaerens]